MSALTPKQAELLAFIKEYQAVRGCSPSFEEMKDVLDLKSKSGIHRLVNGLVERGYLRKAPNLKRALEVVPDPSLLTSYHEPPPLRTVSSVALLAELRRRGFEMRQGQ